MRATSRWWVSMMVLTSMALAGVATAKAPKLNAATSKGMREVVAHYSQTLLTAPFQTEPRARATCTRYLETAQRTLDSEEGAPCTLRLRALKVRAMCSWLAGDDASAAELVASVVALRCGRGDSGMAAGLDLVERWWRPKFIHRFVAAQRMGAKSRKGRLERLDAVKGYVEDTRKALGKDYPRRGGGLLITSVPRGSAASRAGLRKGDLIVSVAARPVRRTADIASHLSSRTAAHTSVLYYRDGQRVEGAWPGVTASQITGVSLPERLP